MINFEEELKRFQPCLEVDEVENVLNTDEIKDMLDLLQSVINVKKGNTNVEA